MVKLYATQAFPYTETGNPPVRELQIGDAFNVADDDHAERLVSQGMAQREEVTESKREELRNANKGGGTRPATTNVVMSKTSEAGQEQGKATDATGGATGAGGAGQQPDKYDQKYSAEAGNIQGPEKPGPSSKADFGTAQDEGISHGGEGKPTGKETLASHGKDNATGAPKGDQKPAAGAAAKK